jgi:hypothetical protein
MRIGISSKAWACLPLAMVLTATVRAESIPPLAAADFGWQSNVADWQEPPEGYGHGPIRPDPDHPYTSNAEGGRLGTQPTKRIADYRDPVLKPWAAAQMKALNDAALSADKRIPFAAQARCYPGGVPGQLLFPFEPLYFIQKPAEIRMIWQRDHMIRRVLLTDRHSENPKPSWFGESIGHYEDGDTLVIDTIGLSTRNSYIDNFRTPHTEKLHVVERLTLDPDRMHLTGIVRVEDPDTFNAPLFMLQRWFKQKGPLKETICGEDHEDYFDQGLFPVPRADRPDF